MKNRRNVRFATEVPRPDHPDGAVCQRRFEEHGSEILLLVDGRYKESVPMGNISISAAGTLHIELFEDERSFPVTVTRKIVKTA